MKDFKISLALAALSIFSGCQYNELKSPSELIDNTLNQQPRGGVPGFTVVKAQVFDLSCTRCHSGISPKAGVSLVDYSSTLASLQTIRRQVESDEMPPRGPKLTLDQKRLLFAWINGGAPESTIAEDAPEPPSTVTSDSSDTPTVPPMNPPSPADNPTNFLAIRSQILEPKCIKCHSTEIQKGQVVLETYEQVLNLKDKIRVAVETDDMPRRAPPLTTELKLILLNWLDAGLPNQN